MNNLRYRPEMAELVRLLRSLGEKNEEIARLLGVTREKLLRWQVLHPDFKKAMAEPAAAELAENALLRRALGFKICESSAEELVDKKSGEILEVLKRRTITKDVPPDVRALLFYLKNRCPERWDDVAGSQYNYNPAPEEEDL